MIPSSNANAEHGKEVIHWRNSPREMFEVCTDIADDEELRDDDRDDGIRECRLHSGRRGVCGSVVAPDEGGDALECFSDFLSRRKYHRVG